MSNSLDLDQDRENVSPDLDPNCSKDNQQTTKTTTSKLDLWLVPKSHVLVLFFTLG